MKRLYVELLSGSDPRKLGIEINDFLDSMDETLYVKDIKFSTTLEGSLEDFMTIYSALIIYQEA